MDGTPIINKSITGYWILLESTEEHDYYVESTKEYSRFLEM